jgi:hypothetical protein
MQNHVLINAEAPNGSPAGQPVGDAVSYACRIVTALAWVGLVWWVFAPKGSGWANAAGYAGMAWILLTAGGYFAESTVRSIVKLRSGGKSE